MVLVIDNYDSFTYNLVQYLGELGAEIRVRRNNEITIGEIEAMGPEQILISPGPGRPENAGITPDVIRRFGPTTPLPSTALMFSNVGDRTKKSDAASVTFDPDVSNESDAVKSVSGSSLSLFVTSSVASKPMRSRVNSC